MKKTNIVIGIGILCLYSMLVLSQQDLIQPHRWDFMAVLPQSMIDHITQNYPIIINMTANNKRGITTSYVNMTLFNQDEGYKQFLKLQQGLKNGYEFARASTFVWPDGKPTALCMRDLNASVKKVYGLYMLNEQLVYIENDQRCLELID